MWTMVDKRKEEEQADQITEWMTELGWKATTGQMRNEQHDGHLEGRSALLIASNRRTINRFPTQFHESNDGHHCLEQILDLGDGIITDCFSFFTATEEESKPSGSGAKIKTKLTMQDGDETKEICIFDINRVGPALASQKILFRISCIRN